MEVCASGRMRKDSNVWETVVAAAVVVVAGAGTGAERSLVGPRTRRERNGHGAGAGVQETCLKHHVDRLRGRLPSVVGVPGV